MIFYSSFNISTLSIYRVLFFDILYYTSYRTLTFPIYRFLFINIKCFTSFCTSTLSIYRLLFIDTAFYTSFRISTWLNYLKIISKSYDISRNTDIKMTKCPVKCRKVDITHVDNWDISKQVEAQKRFRIFVIDFANV